jgi:Domain of unknown function (DUF2382)
LVENKAESNPKPSTKMKRVNSKKAKEKQPIVSNVERGKLRSNASDIIVPMDKQKADVYEVRPSHFVKQSTVGARASQVLESAKEKAQEAVEAIKGVGGLGVTTIDSDISGEPLTLTVLEQKFSTDKKTILETASIEKRWVEGKKFLEVPIKYEQIFVNKEELGKGSLVSGLGEAATQIKHAILKIVPVDLNKKEEAEPDSNSNWVPLLGPDTNPERTFPLYAEQLVISKKVVKVGDVVIRKRQVTKQEMLDVELVHEEVTIENPPVNDTSDTERFE